MKPDGLLAKADRALASADYKNEPINLDSATWAVAQAHRFVIEVRRLVLHNDKA